MKFVHCMILEEKFTKNISSFYDKYFNHGDHSIYYFSRKNDKSINFPFACIKYKIFKNYKYNVLDIVKNINQLRFSKSDYQKVTYKTQQKVGLLTLLFPIAICSIFAM